MARGFSRALVRLMAVAVFLLRRMDTWFFLFLVTVMDSWFVIFLVDGIMDFFLVFWECIATFRWKTTGWNWARHWYWG